MEGSIGLTKEQLEVRRRGVTGSEIAAVAGLSPWQSPIDVYERKIGQGESVPDSHHIERGNFLEGGLLRWLEHRKGYEVRPVGTVVHQDLDFVIATPDGEAVDRETGELVAAVEVKSPSFRSAGDWDDPISRPDGIPDYYIPQVTWECAVLGASVCDVAALIGGDLRVYTVPFNRYLFEVLAEKARVFMQHVESRTPPPVDGSDSATQWLKMQFPKHDPKKKFLTATETDEDMITKYHWVCQEMKQLESEKKLYENRIKERLGDAPGIQGTFGKIHWKRTKDISKIDTRALISHLEENDPETIKNFWMTTPGPRVFRPYWSKGVK
jgi:putative phage-type endonuclease